MTSICHQSKFKKEFNLLKTTTYKHVVFDPSDKLTHIYIYIYIYRERERYLYIDIHVLKYVCAANKKKNKHSRFKQETVSIDVKTRIDDNNYERTELSNITSWLVTSGRLTVFSFVGACKSPPCAKFVWFVCENGGP